MSTSNRKGSPATERTGAEWKLKMLKSYAGIAALACALLYLPGCSTGNQDYNEGKKAEAIRDYDTAVVHYERALKANPTNTEYQLKVDRMRFEAGQYHVEQGQKLRDRGDLQMGLAEFQKAMMIDPSSPIAQQETKSTLDAYRRKRFGGQSTTGRPGIGRAKNDGGTSHADAAVARADQPEDDERQQNNLRNRSQAGGTDGHL